ncbi:transposase, partial [Cohnella thermotolerans]
IQLNGSYRHLQKLRARCEHVFAESKVVHGLDRARSRGLDCMQEQAILTATVQNLKKLCRFKKKRPQTGISACEKPKSVITEVVSGLLVPALAGLFFSFCTPVRRQELT